MTTGISAPMQRDGKSDWKTSKDAQLYAEEIQQALGTNVGELRWDTNRGSKLQRLRHKAVPDEVLRDLAGAWARECLAQEIPEVALRDVQVARTQGEDGQRTGVDITLFFDVVNPMTGALIYRDQRTTVTVQ